MALSIVARLRDGRYDAAAIRPSEPEWPPHPARVFCALVASATEDADWAALTWLEAAGAPQVWASPVEQTAVARSTGFVVINATEGKGGSQTWPGRTNGHRQRTAVMPADHEFALVWPDAEPDDATLGRLVRLARRVPYLGRSTSSVELTVVPDVIDPKPTWTVHRPAPLGAPDGRPVRVPYPGYVDTLRAAYGRGDRSWEFSRSRAYVADMPATPSTVDADAAGDPVEADAKGRAPSGEGPVAGPYQDLLVWGIQRGRTAISGDRLVAVTGALRRAVLSRVPDPIPALISGHGADGQPHVAYLGLPSVGHEYSDGHLLGLAVAVPRTLGADDRRTLLRALLGEPDPLTNLTVPWGRPLDLEYRPERTKPWGLVPERWTAGRRGASRWVSVTPVMLDRFPKRHHGVAELLARSLVAAGYPEPQAVDILPTTPVQGGIHRPRSATLPEGRPRRPFVHCRIAFATPVVGPVIAGSLRYLGSGLFVPERDGNAHAD